VLIVGRRSERPAVQGVPIRGSLLIWCIDVPKRWDDQRRGSLASEHEVEVRQDVGAGEDDDPVSHAVHRDVGEELGVEFDHR
jgi:hypothetical protein